MKSIFNKENLHKYFIPLMIILTSAIIAVTSIKGKTATSDESSHLVRGRVFLETFDYRLNQHNPVGFNVIQALPTLLNNKIEMEDLNNNYDWDTADKNKIKNNWEVINGGIIEFADRVLTGPRIWMILLNTAMLYFFYTFVFKKFNVSVATIATSLVAFSPTFIAHIRFITTDVPVMWAIFFGTATLYNYIEAKKEDRRKYYIIFMLVSILGLQVKFNATMTAVIWLLCIFGAEYLRNKDLKVLNRIIASMKMPLITAAIWFLSIFISYGFQVNTLEAMTYNAGWRLEGNTKNLTALGEKLNGLTPWNNNDEIIIWVYKNVPLPFPQYINGFVENVIIHNYFWYGKYILGMHLGPEHNIPYYFPVAFLVKETIPTIILTITSFFASAYLMLKKRFDIKNIVSRYHIFLVVSAFLAFMLLKSSINLGIRHLLVLYPFMFIWVGVIVNRIYNKYNKKAVIATLSVFLVFALGSIIRVHPDFIAYFNEFAGGPEKGWWVVRGTNFDWNQDDGFALQYSIDNNAVFNAEDLPDNEEGLYIARVKNIYGSNPPKELLNIRNLYRRGEIERVDNIHHTYWVFKVRKDQLITEDDLTLKYELTQCSNPWDDVDGIIAPTVEERIGLFLQDMEIEIENFEIIEGNEDIATCEACNCPANKTLIIIFKDKNNLDTFKAFLEE